MKLYVDCTLTYERKIETGIQRVVKKIVQHDCGDQKIEVVPIRYDGFGFLRVSPRNLEPTKLSKIVIFCRTILAKTIMFNFAKKIYNCGLYMVGFFRSFLYSKKYIYLKSHDIMLVADLIQSEKYIRELQSLKSKQVIIYQVAYDILPIKYPEFFNSPVIETFKKVADSWPTYSSKIFAISNKVAKELEIHLNVRNAEYFYLGADFTKRKSWIPGKTVFDRNSYFLSVGTIEPRKNHLYILKTFQQLWANGSEEKLVFIGRLGWRFKETLTEINHVQSKYPDKFLWLNQANDKMLDDYYKSAKGVICASYDEGFGLPIVEALAKGVNVLCSDIEVFREVGGNNCAYFKLNQFNEDSLYALIRSGRYKKDLSNFVPLTWQQAINGLLEKVKSDISRRLHDQSTV